MTAPDGDPTEVPPVLGAVGRGAGPELADRLALPRVRAAAQRAVPRLQGTRAAGGGAGRRGRRDVHLEAEDDKCESFGMCAVHSRVVAGMLRVHLVRTVGELQTVFASLRIFVDVFAMSSSETSFVPKTVRVAVALLMKV